MKKGILLLVLSGVIVSGVFLYTAKRSANPQFRLERAARETEKLAAGDRLRDGDLIFHTSLSAQSRAIQLATGSKYSHCGIIYKTNGGYAVFEAVQPVKSTPLETWIARGKGAHYVVRRLKDADRVLTPEVLARMKREGEKFRGKAYDLAFEWSDQKIYCSELIWKIYQRAAGIELGELQQLGDFDLSDEAVKAKLNERYGDNIPLGEPVISPRAIYESRLLVTIRSK